MSDRRAVNLPDNKVQAYTGNWEKDDEENEGKHFQEITPRTLIIFRSIGGDS
jgi:hypothetical protein